MDLKKYLIKDSTGIHAHLEEDQKGYYSLCLLSRKDNNVKVSKMAVGSIDQLFEKIPSSTVFNLIISGKGVLTKSLTYSDKETPDEEIINTLFPNIESSKVYYSIYRTTTSVNASIVKKEIVDELLKTFHSKNLFFTAVFIGPYTASFLAPILKKNKNINLGGCTFSFTDSNETKLVSNSGKSGTQNIKVGDEELAPEFHFAYAAAFAYFISNPLFSTSTSGSIKEGKSLFHHKLFFQKAFMPSLSLILLLALINFIFFYFQQTKHDGLLATYNFKKSEIINIDFYTEEIKRNTALLSSLNFEDQQIYSFFLDRLANARPPGITWQTVEVNSILEEKKSFIINSRTILITGKANDAASLNAWIKDVKRFPWLEKISKQNFIYDLRNKVGDFELELIFNLNLNDDDQLQEAK